MSSGGGRFDGTAVDDPAALLAAVRSSIFQVCKEQLAAEVKRLRPALDSGSASSESAAALGVVLAEAASVVAEADDALRLRGLADDDATGWPSRRALLEGYIQRCRIILAGLESASPENRRLDGSALVTIMNVISAVASGFCGTPRPPAYLARPASTPGYLARPPSTPGYLTRPASYLIWPASTSASVDDLASGIDAVQVSGEE